MTYHHNASDSARRPSAGVLSASAGLAAPEAADGARRKRSIVRWILLFAVLVLPW
jgi:hypothetical protein